MRLWMQDASVEQVNLLPPVRVQWKIEVEACKVCEKRRVYIKRDLYV